MTHSTIRLRYSLRKFDPGSGFIFLFTTLTGLYYTVIDLFGDDLPFISNYKYLHQGVVLTLVATTMIFTFIHWLVGKNKKKELEEAIEVTNNFITTLANIVACKVKRFEEKAKTLKKNKFNYITLPGEQIKFIYAQAIDFLRKQFRLAEDEIDITILEKLDDKDWKYWESHQSWKRTEPNMLFKHNSAASVALQSGEYRFIASKEDASSKKEYFLSKRDLEKGDGSIFIAPITVFCKNIKYEYIISISSYGKRFANPWDEIAYKSAYTFLREISRRIELELHLKTIKISSNK